MGKAKKKRKVVLKKGAAKKGAKKKAPPSETGATIHGVPINPGDMKKAGRGKGSLVTFLPRNAVKIIKGFNPRVNMGDLNPLAESIRKEGILTSLVVRPRPGKPGVFDVVAGERRLRAAEKAGLKEVPVLVRTDLEGKDVEAQAVSVAENGENGRFNLNAVEIGRVLLRLKKHNWPTPRMASVTTVNIGKVRRCLALMSAPKDVCERVEKGSLSVLAGVELAKVDDSVRKEISDLVKTNATAKEIRRLAKTAAKEAGAQKPAATPHSSKGATRAAAVATWKGTKVKQGMLGELCDCIKSLEDDKGTVSYHETRGAIAALFWDRGNLDTPFAPTLDPTEEDDVKAAKAALAAFEEMVEAEVYRHSTKQPKDGG